jgi:signal transduction histidine kinase/HPt (histidine-containing phosphotransfer) domain-containing protein
MGHLELDDNRRILIVDDNADIHTDYRRVLSDNHGADSLAAAEANLFGESAAAEGNRPAFELCHASQGEEGYQLLCRETREGRPFALAFVDMRMPPGWDGLTTIKRLWEADPRLQVVLCTAYSDHSWFEICDALSPKDRLLILKKPFDAIEVRQLAASLVTKWNLSRAADRSQRELERAVELRTQQLREAKEAADRASRSKSEFLANISHEIRTPLTAILGFTKLLMDGADQSEERNDYLQIIRANAEHQLVLINDLLDVSKIEAGKLQIQRVACPVHDILDEVMQTLRYRAEEKGLVLTSAWPLPATEPVYTDPSRLRQLLINLITNAIKFTDSGSVKVVAQMVSIEERKRLQVEVIDTGMGIAQEKQELIFEPFVQADGSIARRYGGTGLGLAISRSLAGLLGGTLRVTSQLGVGSTFTLVIDAEHPAQRDAFSEESATAGSREASAPLTALRGCRLLVVEDNPFNRKLIRLTFERAGAVVEMAENGRCGVEKAERATFDVVLMDMQMPVMDGFTATTHFRRRGYAGPIIALTAHALPEEREKCLAAGCDGFVSKPIDLDHLHAVVAEFALSTAGSGKPLLAEDGCSPCEATDPDLQEVAREFLAWLPEAISELRQALVSRDYDTLAALSHTLKGSGGTFGYPEVTRAAERLEAASRRRDDLQINGLLRDLIAFVECKQPLQSS